MKLFTTAALLAASLLTSNAMAQQAPASEPSLAPFKSSLYFFDYGDDLKHEGVFPLVYSFDHLGSEFTNVGEFDFTVTHEATPTGGTGPNAASEGKRYGYLETSPGHASSKGDTAILESAEINTEETYVSFDYHMYGPNIGHLYLEAQVNGSWVTLWRRGGQQVKSANNGWKSASVSLANLNVEQTKVRFRAVANGGYKGDIALDNITIDSDLYFGRVDIYEAAFNAHNFGAINIDWLQIPGVLSYTRFIIGTNEAGEKRWIHIYDAPFLNPHPTPFYFVYQTFEPYDVCDVFGEGKWQIQAEIWAEQDETTASITPNLGLLDCNFY